MSPLLDKPHSWFRTWFRKVWKVRGGGLYACGFAIAFLMFEARSLADDIAAVGSVFDGRAVDFIIELFIDSLKNTIRAFMWPVHVVRFAPPWGAIALGFAFVGFTAFLKKPIEGWLFADKHAPEQTNS